MNNKRIEKMRAELDNAIRGSFGGDFEVEYEAISPVRHEGNICDAVAATIKKSNQVIGNVVYFSDGCVSTTNDAKYQGMFDNAGNSVKRCD
ncbi:MAG: hypothetical protein HZB68_05460 [Candidatus Aenigmarchaeota archaeon]|nr:hypothetical protein [Candidatus Aenigmarchaeota archaeon]